MKPKVIVFASSKGGVGKTTLASAIAVRATQDKYLVGMLDLDPQEGLTRWWARRGEVDNPRVYTGVDRISDALEALDQVGVGIVVIDTPPALMRSISDAIEAADCVVMPIKASAHDVAATDPALELINAHGKPYVAILNEVFPREGLTRTVREYLEEEGYQLSSSMVARRQAYAASATVGKSGPEVEKGHDCATEIDALWGDILRMLGLRKRGGRR